MDICTKVTLRQRLLPSGKITLYLDYYPEIRIPRLTNRKRHEYMGIYLYGNRQIEFSGEFNQTMLEKAEIIRCRRQEQVINRPVSVSSTIHSSVKGLSRLLRGCDQETLSEMENRVYALSQNSPAANVLSGK